MPVARHPETVITRNTLLTAARERLWSPYRPGQRLSRTELADAVNAALDQLYPRRNLTAHYVDFRWVGKLERGEHRWPSEERRAALRHVLGAATDAELGLYSPRRTPSKGDSLAASPFMISSSGGVDFAELRGCLDVFDVPPDGPIRTMAELRTVVNRIVRMRLASNYRQLAVELPPLLHELHRARLSWIGAHRETAAALLTQVYRAADALADKLGHIDLSARLVTMMLGAAEDTTDPTIIATAQYVRGELFFHNGRPESGQALLERAAADISSDTSRAGLAAYGALHMRAAALAGLAQRRSHAHDHLREAGESATHVPDGEYHGTAFGPSSVRIHAVTLALDSGDPDVALRCAGPWRPPARVPSERSSHFYVDLARAHALTGSPALAIDSLLRARTVAPEHVHIHPHVRHVIDVLRPQVLANGALRDYARWLAKPLASSAGSSRQAGPVIPPPSPRTR